MSLSNINPVKRLEYFLQDIADGKETPTKAPVRRIEEFLRRIAVKIAENSGSVVAGLTQIVNATSSGNISTVDATVPQSSDGVRRLIDAGFGYEPIHALGDSAATTKMLKDRLFVTLNGIRLGVENVQIRSANIKIDFQPITIPNYKQLNSYLLLYPSNSLLIHTEIDFAGTPPTNTFCLTIQYIGG